MVRATGCTAVLVLGIEPQNLSAFLIRTRHTHCFVSSVLSSFLGVRFIPLQGNAPTAVTLPLLPQRCLRSKNRGFGSPHPHIGLIRLVISLRLCDVLGFLSTFCFRHVLLAFLLVLFRRA